MSYARQMQLCASTAAFASQKDTPARGVSEKGGGPPEYQGTDQRICPFFAMVRQENVQTAAQPITRSRQGR